MLIPFRVKFFVHFYPEQRAVLYGAINMCINVRSRKLTSSSAERNLCIFLDEKKSK